MILFSQNQVLPLWAKTSRLIFVPKPDGTLRPICLLNLLGILIERLFQLCLDPIIFNDPLLKNRYGFIKKRSTEDIVGQIISDIEQEKLEKRKVALLSLDSICVRPRDSHLLIHRTRRPTHSVRQRRQTNTLSLILSRVVLRTHNQVRKHQFLTLKRPTSRQPL